MASEAAEEPTHAVGAAALAAGWSHRHRDVSGGWLRPTVFGAVDGLVTNASLIAGVGGGGVSAHAIILTGEGRGFCSGLDLKDTAAGRGLGGSLSGGGASHISTRDIPTVTPINV